MGRHEQEASGSEQGPVTSSCVLSNEPSGSIKGRDFLDLAA